MSEQGKYRNGLIFLTLIIFIGFIIVFGLGGFKLENILFLILGVIVLLIGWAFYYYQDKTDKENKENKAFSTINKVNSFYIQGYAIGVWFLSLLSIFIIIYSVSTGNYFIPDNKWLNICLFSIIVLAGLFVGIYLWQRGKTLAKGRVY
jgi:hypothetical protein